MLSLGRTRLGITSCHGPLSELEEPEVWQVYSPLLTLGSLAAMASWQSRRSQRRGNGECLDIAPDFGITSRHASLEKLEEPEVLQGQVSAERTPSWDYQPL